VPDLGSLESWRNSHMAPKQSGQSMRCSIIYTGIADLAERYLMPAELVCCMWHLNFHSPVHFLAMPGFAVSASSTFISAPSLVISPCMLTLTCKRSAPPRSRMSGTFQIQVRFICPRSVICQHCSICIHSNFAILDLFPSSHKPSCAK
jgi:hypothetical protein